MALSEFTLRLVEKKLEDYCRGRVHEALCHRVRIGYAIEGDLVTLFEERRGLLNPEKWVRLDMARFRFDDRTKKWSLYYVDTDSAWHSYYLNSGGVELPPSIDWKLPPGFTAGQAVGQGGPWRGRQIHGVLLRQGPAGGRQPRSPSA